MPSDLNSPYSWSARSFHWLSAILVLVTFILSEGGPESRIFSDTNRTTLTIHESLGTAVFILTVIRLIWRAFDRQPSPVPMPAWMHLASILTHWVLFGLLVLVPVTAIAGSWLEGHALSLYIFGDYGSPIGSSALIGKAILGIHPLLGDAIIWIAGLHAAAALFHHFILKDGVLKAMLP